MGFMKTTSVAAIAGVAFEIAISVAAASPAHRHRHHRNRRINPVSTNWRDCRYVRRGGRGRSCNERVWLRRAWSLWRPSLLRSAVTIPAMVKIVERADKDHPVNKGRSVN